MVYDYVLMDWIGVNFYCILYYFYVEEMFDWVDEYGIVVIDEIVVVGFNFFLGIGFEVGNKLKELYSEEVVNGEIQQVYLQVIKELIVCDKNYLSVVMWSIVNELDICL